MAYCTVQQFKDSIYYIGLEDFFTSNTQISGFLDGVASIIDNYCGRTFVTGAYQDVFVGKGSRNWFTDNMPIISITSITYQTVNSGYDFLSYDNASYPSGTLDSSLYWHTRQGLIKSAVPFSCNRIWTVSYIAGYQSDNYPPVLKEANMMLAKIMADSSDAGNLAVPEGSTLNRFKFDKFEEEYVAGNSSSRYEADSLPPTIAGMLKKFKYSRTSQ